MMVYDKRGDPLLNAMTSLEEEDVLPTCEFNQYVKKWDFHFPWQRIFVKETCNMTAVWFIVVETDACTNSVEEPHDHIIMCCDEHVKWFEDGRIEWIDCPNLFERSDYQVVSIDRI